MGVGARCAIDLAIMQCLSCSSIGLGEKNASVITDVAISGMDQRNPLLLNQILLPSFTQLLRQ